MKACTTLKINDNMFNFQLHTIASITSRLIRQQITNKNSQCVSRALLLNQEMSNRQCCL